MTQSAESADNASKELKNMIDVFEANYPFPQIECEIPGIGLIDNLFNYTWYHLKFATDTEQEPEEQEAFKYHFNQCNIILSYLFNEGLTSQEIKPIPQTIRREVLELHSRYTYEDQHNRFDKHPKRERIGELWRGIEKDYHTPQLNSHLTELKQIIQQTQ
jgi:hypothetical protein